MRRVFVRVLALFGLMITLGTMGAGCYVRTGPGHCPGGYWVEGHYGPRGRWHAGHWRCPGVIEIE